MRAILSVYDKSGLVELARELAGQGVELFSTGGTQRAMEQAGLKVHAVEEITGDRKSTRLNSSHIQKSRMPSSA